MTSANSSNSTNRISFPSKQAAVEFEVPKSIPIPIITRFYPMCAFDSSMPVQYQQLIDIDEIFPFLVIKASEFIRVSMMQN